MEGKIGIALGFEKNGRSHRMDIFKAIRTGDMNAVNGYLRDGGDVNAADGNKMTLLLLAVDEHRPEMVKVLIKAKAGLNLKDKYGQTALMLAAGRNDTESVQLLIAAKADLNMKSVSGATALGFAVENGNNAAASLLKKAGAK